MDWFWTQEVEGIEVEILDYIKPATMSKNRWTNLIRTDL